jgi:hypothetical protein
VPGWVRKVDRALQKKAAEAVRGEPVSRYLSLPVGGLWNAANFTPLVTGDLSAFRSSKEEDVVALLKEMEKEYPEELKDTRVVYGGGYHPLATLKRHFTNKKTSLLGKILGLPNSVIAPLIGGILRSPMYLPNSDEVIAPWDNLGVLSHELGHAVDFNSNTKGLNDPSFLKNQFARLKRDAYLLARGLSFSTPLGNIGLPGITYYQEHKAWEKARKALQKVLARGSQLTEKQQDKWFNQYADTRIPALSTYAVNEAAPLLNLVPGMSIAAWLAAIIKSRQLTGFTREDLADGLMEEIAKREEEREKEKEKLV